MMPHVHRPGYFEEYYIKNKEKINVRNKLFNQKARLENRSAPSGPYNNGFKLMRVFTTAVRSRNIRAAQIIARNLYERTGDIRKELESMRVSISPTSTNYILSKYEGPVWVISPTSYTETWVPLHYPVAYKMQFHVVNRKKANNCAYWIFNRYLLHTSNLDLPLAPQFLKCSKCRETYRCEGIGFVHKCDSTHYHVGVYKRTRSLDQYGDPIFESYQFKFRIESLAQIPFLPPTFFIGHFFKFEGPYDSTCGLCNNDPSDYEISEFEDKQLEAA